MKNTLLRSQLHDINRNSSVFDGGWAGIPIVRREDFYNNVSWDISPLTANGYLNVNTVRLGQRRIPYHHHTLAAFKNHV